MGDDVYTYIGNMRSITSSFSNLDISSEDIRQYFFWTGMNRNFQDQLVQITNSTKPSLQQINDNIFAATERYLKLSESNKKSSIHFSVSSQSSDDLLPITNNLAVNVKAKPGKYCVLCDADNLKYTDHLVKECTVYNTAAKKVTKLDALKYCSKCTFMNHTASQCKFKFTSPCRFCKREHMSYLCLREPNSIASNVSCVHFNSVVKNDNVILPSFSVNIRQNNSSILCRVLNDTGSQRNFITKKLVDDLSLPVAESDVDLKVHGFNSEKLLKTDIVRVPIEIGSASHEIKAIVVPSINLSLNCRNLGTITEHFIKKGYILADKGLGSSSKVANFGLVMGPDSVKLLCPRTVLFGDEEPAIYLQSEVGVMLLGETNNLITNLRHLPYNLSLPKFKNASSSILDTDSDKSISHEPINVNVCSSTVNDILDDHGNVNIMKLNEASVETLEALSSSFMNYDNHCDEENILNTEVVENILGNVDRTVNGRLIMDLPWNPNCKDKLATNTNLSKKILLSNYKRLIKEDKLTMYDAVFREQEDVGVIERIEDVEGFLKSHPEHSFLPHMGVFKPGRETTKCRVVFLSNLCEKKQGEDMVSHNAALLPGPSLNTKLAVSLLLSRFDKYVLIFDIAKAFLGIQLREKDQNKLLCWWFRDVSQGDFSLIIYRNLRLSFGLRPSPAILMLALYKMMIIDIDNDDKDTIKLKRQVYNKLYMDNGIVGTNKLNELNDFYQKLPLIFSDYQLNLQQFACNDCTLQTKIDSEQGKVTENEIKYFGMKWVRNADTIGPYQIFLDINAKTKRSILSSLNSVYDLLNASLPLLNRPKLFMQKLQCEYELEWDAKLNEALLAEWHNICKQSNGKPPLKVERLVGSKDSSYTLVAFSDASAAIYGTVVYLVENSSGKVSFICAKNKLINSKTSKKTIPSLEFQGVVFAADTIVSLYTELCTDRSVDPIKITNLVIYTDSMVCLSWIRSYFVEFQKMQKKSVFILNRLKHLNELCISHPVTFRFIEGKENPSDYVTRPISYACLLKTSYLTGPAFLKNLGSQPDVEITLSNPVSLVEDGTLEVTTLCTVNCDQELDTTGEHLVEPTRVSSFRRLVNVHGLVLKFVDNLKGKVNSRKINDKWTLPDASYVSRASIVLVRHEQQICFPEIYKFLKQQNEPANNKIPNLILQLNLYLDKDYQIRVKGKFKNNYNPILLSNKSYISELIVRDLHESLSHVGIYSVLKELRKRFWILRGFSFVRRVLKNCVVCKKMNEPPLKLSQNSYREFRSDPPQIPFRSIFIDYIGHINVRFDGKIKKSWILIVTCLWSRAISLQICYSANTSEFLRAMQLHVYKHGLFSSCMSDLGSQISAGSKIISEFLSDNCCREYFDEQGINRVSFEQYPKGNSSLGSLIEVLVKQTKQLLFKFNR